MEEEKDNIVTVVLQGPDDAVRAAAKLYFGVNPQNTTKEIKDELTMALEVVVPQDLINAEL